MKQPFKEGQKVIAPKNPHFGIMEVIDCYWYERRDGTGYWLVKASPHLKEGGIISHSCFQASHDHFQKAV